MYNSLRFCYDDNGLREIWKKVYSRKTSNQKPWTLSQALDFTKRKLEGDRPLGNSIGALLGSLFNNKYVERIGEKPQFVTKSF